MTKKMLIDASHPEESRVAIVNDQRLEEFDFETSTKKQLKGNIYLAKVIRIEPSLQAAFVEFGGNRHGFLAFNEIHPDYYRIPIEDREALLASQQDETIEEEITEETSSKEDVETLGGEDVEEINRRPRRPVMSRQYKIQEVIKRRQIMLVQVVKEERGGKGAALTTYLSLAGRYCVLMPNAAKGGGISRKITSASDRKRLREIIESINLPEAMSLIVRTAGMSRSKVEIKKDSDYLIQLWNDIRDKTLHSIAPCLIYEESDLIKRAIRDYYSRDAEEILIEGEDGYKEAKEFIRKLMPSHVKKVKQYKDEKVPLFHHYGVEKQIDAMHNPVVQLRSGGYIVFGTTEALVAIDVNSGKATRERHIEETAFKTNLEAAEEIARQLRLRDLAGLVVIDFIDMDEGKNVEAVERRLKDAMRTDRARVQVGKISAFGLLELSRQRLRPNIIESTSLPCAACKGTGMIRSVESSSLHVLRAIEEEALLQKVTEIIVYVPVSIVLYILNQKRKAVQDIETRYNLTVRFSKDDSLIPPDYRIERVRAKQETTAQDGFSRKKEEPQNQPQRTGQQQAHRQRKHGQNRPQREQKPAETQPKELSPQSSSIEGEQDQTRSKSRRRYRKFDRRHQRPREDNQAQSASPVQERPIQSPQLEAVANESVPIKPSKKSAKPAPDGIPTPETTPRKKGASRKGWWQRLLE
jgi:ribonuclease E